MGITGTGEIKRELLKVFMDVSDTAAPEWELLGEKVEEMSLELNPNVETVTDVTGVTSVTLDRYEEQTSVDPMVAKRDSKAFAVLYDIVKNKKTLSEVEKTFLIVNAFDVDGTNYAAWIQKAVVAVQSFGGGSGALKIPFNIHWIGERTYGTFNPTTKAFTAGVNPTYLVTFSVSGTASARLAGAQILVNGLVLITDDNGIADIQLEAGTYPYTAVKTGYSNKTGSVAVTTSAKYEAVAMVV